MIGTIAKLWGAAALVAGASLFAETAAEQPPVPSSETGQENAGGKMAGNLLSGTLMPQIPSNISITNDGAKGQQGLALLDAVRYHSRNSEGPGA